MNAVRKEFKGFGLVLMQFASAQVVSNLLRITSGFMIVRLLSPELYGSFSGVGIYSGYILLGHGGIINGLSRELPYELGRNNDDYARQLASSTFVLTVIICLLAALVFLTFGFLSLLEGNVMSAGIYFAYVVIGGLSLLNKQYLPVLYRTNRDFSSLSKQNISIGIANLFSVILVYFFSIYGLIARGMILALFEFYLLFKFKPYKLSLSARLTDFRKLFKTGVPIFMVGQVGSLWDTIMNNVILSIGGFLNYGLYALSSIVQNAVGVIPSSFSQLIYPRMGKMLGEGKSVRLILRAHIKPLLFQLVLMLIISTSGALVLPYLIPEILPKYVDGIVAAQWMLFLPLAKSFGALNNIYNVVKRQKLYFFSLVTGAVLGSVYVFWKLETIGFRLEYFPQGLIIGTLIQQLLSLFFLSTLYRHEEA